VGASRPQRSSARRSRSTTSPSASAAAAPSRPACVAAPRWAIWVRSSCRPSRVAAPSAAR
jgi:hypothetical protein